MGNVLLSGNAPEKIALHAFTIVARLSQAQDAWLVYSRHVVDCTQETIRANTSELSEFLALCMPFLLHSFTIVSILI